MYKIIKFSDYKNFTSINILPVALWFNAEFLRNPLLLSGKELENGTEFDSLFGGESGRGESEEHIDEAKKIHNTNKTKLLLTAKISLEFSFQIVTI